MNRYSYDSFEANERFKQSDKRDIQSRIEDLYSKFSRIQNRGKVPKEIMDEIGYQDCDWIAVERSWKFWPNTFSNWSIPLELHLPCRDPVDHLLSQCNHRHKAFNCNATEHDMIQQIDDCIVLVNERFSTKLADKFPIKCFSSDRSSEYMEWMGTRLDRKRIETEYVFRASNRDRKKDKECVWEHMDIQDVIRKRLLEKYDYYAFCNECLGSERDIFRVPTNSIGTF